MNLFILLKQTLFLLAFLILSWILVHFLALFGFFLALAIPLLHLSFAPQHILCFWCRLTHTPHRFRHSLLDSLLALVLTLISLTLVYGEYRLITHYLRPATPKIASFTLPTKNQYLVGEIFTFPLSLERIPAPINIFQADLSYDPNLLEVVDLTTDQSFASFFVQKEYDNTLGYLRLAGGVPNPGYSEASGLLGTVYFRPKQPGATELLYLDTSLVLANDGAGTNLLSDFPKIPLILLPNSNPPTPPPSDLTVSTQVQGDTDKTVLSFTEYAEKLPAPHPNVYGVATSAATPASLPSATNFTDLLFKLDHSIFAFWRGFLPL